MIERWWILFIAVCAIDSTISVIEAAIRLRWDWQDRKEKKEHA